MASNFPRITTLAKWKTEHTWLTIRNHRMYCTTCTKWEQKLVSCRNFSDSFISKGSDNFRISNVRDHAKSQMHEEAINQENREVMGENYRQHVVKLIPQDNVLRGYFKKMSENERKMMKQLFEVSYFIGKQGRPFSDFPQLLELEKLHGVNFPSSYGHRNACKEFIQYTSETIFEETIKNKVLRANFISVLCDGSTDSGILEKEVIYIVFVDPDTFVPTCSYFALKDLSSQDAAGIKEGIKEAFHKKGLDSILSKMVFLSSDGTATNSGLTGGLITLFRRDMPWVAFVWCFSHRLELSLKDALASEFESVEESLRHLFYIYQNSSKKLRELRSLFQILQNVYEFSNNQVRPAKSGGTRWIDHKVRACSQMVDKLGVYVQHIENIIADTSKKACDRDALSGKVKKLKSAALLLRSAVFVDLLDSARKFSLVSQQKDVNILLVVDKLDDTILHYQLLFKKLKKDVNFVFELPTVKSVLSKIDGDGCYQGVTLTHTVQAKASLPGIVTKSVENILACLTERYGLLTPRSFETEKDEMIELVTRELRDGDAVLHDVCKVLRTTAWVMPNGNLTLDNLSILFAEQVNSLKQIFDRYQDLILNSNKSVSYTLLEDQYLRLVKYTSDCMGIQVATLSPLDMWQVLRRIKKDEFSELFLLVELCFCAPFSNATLERFFNHMSLVKTDWRNRLDEQALESCLRLQVDGPDLATFSQTYADKAVTKWYNDKPRRLNQRKLKKYRQRKSAKLPHPGVSLEIDAGMDTDSEMYIDSSDTENSSDSETN